jgi:hypothetical protein
MRGSTREDCIRRYDRKARDWRLLPLEWPTAKNFVALGFISDEVWGAVVAMFLLATFPHCAAGAVRFAAVSYQSDTGQVLYRAQGFGCRVDVRLSAEFAFSETVDLKAFFRKKLREEAERSSVGPEGRKGGVTP